MPTPQNQHPQTLGERPPRRRTPSHYLNRAENDPLFEVSIGFNDLSRAEDLSTHRQDTKARVSWQTIFSRGGLS